MKKTCNLCGEAKPLDQFRKRNDRADGRTYSCKPCLNVRSKECYDYNPTKKRDEQLRRDFGISLADYNRMLEEQGGRCAICATDTPTGKGSFHVDHCHDTGKVRGLLCHHCNVGLGNFKDDALLLEVALAYLKDHAPQRAELNAALTADRSQ